MEQLSLMKNIELDKICRICLTVKKDMRPLFGEMIAEMLSEICSSVQITHEDGWPEQICIQCVHQVSRCHAFKKRIEKSDKELRQYIKGLTVIVEEPIEIPRAQELKTHQIQRPEPQQMAPPQLQEIQIQRSDPHPNITHHAQQPMLVANILNNNNAAQIINGQIVTTANGQQLIQTANGLVQAAQIGQFVQGPNNTVQMITQNGTPAQILQIQRGDDRCEIIVQPTDLGETNFYEEIPVLMTTNGQNTIQIHSHALQQQQQHLINQQIQQQHQQQQIELQHQQNQEMIQHEIQEIDEDDDGQEQEETVEYELMKEEDEEEEIIQEQQEQQIVQTVEESEPDLDEKQLFADFISQQTRCEGPGRYICNLCRKEFKHSKWLHSHMKSHSNWIKANCKKLPQCEICHKSFRGPGMLRMHLKSHEKENKLPTCTICNKEFKSKSILYRHRQTHFEQKLHKCGICSKIFSSNYQLNAHMARHKGEKNHHCPHCDKSYYNNTDLKNHVQQHLGIKVKKPQGGQQPQQQQTQIQQKIN